MNSLQHDDEPPRGLYAVDLPNEGQTRTPPHDADAERAVLGGMLLSTTARHDVIGYGLDGRDFYLPAHETIYNAIVDLHALERPVETVALADYLRGRGDLPRIGGAPYLHTLISSVATPANAAYYARIVREIAPLRALTTAATKISQLGYTAIDAGAGTQVNDLLAAALAEIDTIRRDHDATTDRPTAPNIDEFLAADDNDTYDWLIPGLLERRDRFILTAGEGHGKSTLLRQFAIQTAAGIDPFTLQPCPPARVLIVDLENSDKQSRRKLRPLRAAAGIHATTDFDPDNLHIECRTAGLNLADPDDERWLTNLVGATRADLLITGPIYKLAAGDPNDEKDAKPIAQALDRIRDAHGCAVLLEAHSKKAEGTDPKKRPKEPFGWSGWLRWPEFGYHLAEDGTLTSWRGDREEDRHVPRALNRGGTWPWTPDDTRGAAGLADNEARWQTIRRAIWQAGKDLSDRQLADATGIPRSTIQRVLGGYAMQKQALLYQLQLQQQEADS